MKKKLFGILLLLVMLLPFMSVRVFAVEDYGIRISGTPVKSTQLTGEGWSFDPNTYTLTLNNYKIGTFGYDVDNSSGDADKTRYIIYMTTEKTVTINIKGNNVIGDDSYIKGPSSYLKYGNTTYSVRGIRASAPIVFKGDGQLLISTHSWAIYSPGVTFDGVNIKVQSSYSAIDCAYFKNNKPIILKNGARVSTRTYAGRASDAAISTDTLEIYDTSRLEAQMDTAHNGNGTAAVNTADLLVSGGTVIGKGYMYNDTGMSNNPVVTGVYVRNKATIKDGGTVEGYVYQGWKQSFPVSAVYIRSKLNFEGAGVVRYYNEVSDTTYKTLHVNNDNITCADRYSLFKSGTDDNGELRASAYEGIFLRENNGKKEISYFENFAKTETFPKNLTFDELIPFDPTSAITVVSGNFTLEPTATDKAVPQLIVKGGSLTLSMKDGKTYELQNQIEIQKNGELIIEGDGRLKGLNITGEGTVRFKSGTVFDGKLGTDVNAIVNGGSIWMNDNGKVKDSEGRQAARTPYRFIKADIEKILSVSLSSGSYDLTGMYSPSDEWSEEYFCFWLNASNIFSEATVRVRKSAGGEAGDYTFVSYGTWNTEYGATVHMEKKVDPDYAEYGSFSVVDTAVLNPAYNNSFNNTYSVFVYNWSQKFPATTWSFSRDGGKNWEALYRYGKRYCSSGSFFFNLKDMKQDFGIDIESMADINGWIFRAESRDIVYNLVEGEADYIEKKITATHDVTVYYHDPSVKSDKEQYIGRETATFTAETLKAPKDVILSYNWKVSKDSGKTYEDIGCYIPVYTVLTTPEMDGWIYKCEVNANWIDDQFGNRWDLPLSCQTTLHVNGMLPLLTENPQDLTVTQGVAGGSFTVKAEDADSYQWQVSTDKRGKNFEDISGATSTTYTIDTTDIDPGMNLWQYRCVVTNASGSVTSEAANLTVKYEPFISKVLEDTAIHEGTKIGNGDAKYEYNFDRGNPRKDFTYEVEVSYDGGNTFEKLEKLPEDKNLGQGGEWSYSVNGIQQYIYMRGIVIKNATVDMNGLQFRAAMTYNGETTYSEPFTLTVTPHSWDNGTVTKEPTCTAAGEKIYTCTECKATKTETVNALGHDWKDATCTEPKTCAKCKLTEGNPLGHTFGEYVSDGNATCTEDGTKSAKCVRCDEKMTMADVGSATGHDWKDATCTEPKTCAKCKLTEGNALGHEFINYVSDNNATCTQDGTKTAKCTRCDATDSKVDEGTMRPHDWRAATCTEPKTCAVCHLTEGNALGHAYDSAWSADSKNHWHVCNRCNDKKDVASHIPARDEATEEAPVRCTTCGYVLQPQLEHTHHLTKVDAVDPTCEKNGHTSYYICSGCEEWFEDENAEHVIKNHDDVIKKAAHDWKEATCTEPKTCVRCQLTEGYPLGHDWKEATCTKPMTCKLCDITQGDILGHDWKAATCTSPRTCLRCAATEGEPDQNQHEKLVKIDANPSTVTTSGNREYWHCKDCDKFFSDAEAKNEVHEEDMKLPKLPPEIIGGMNSKWTKKSNSTLTFKSNAAYADFRAVLVDGNEVASEQYTVSEGSTVVELKTAYLETLAAGDHSLTIRSESGDAGTTFTVAVNADPVTPNPGENPGDTPTTKPDENPGDTSIPKPGENPGDTSTPKSDAKPEDTSTLKPDDNKKDTATSEKKESAKNTKQKKQSASKESGKGSSQASSATANTPETGDTENYMLWLVLLGASAGAIGGTIVLKKKRRKSNR